MQSWSSGSETQKVKRRTININRNAELEFWKAKCKNRNEKVQTKKHQFLN